MQVDEASFALPSVPLHLYRGTFWAEFFSPRHTFSEKSKILHKEVSIVLMLRRKLTYTVQRIPLPLCPLYVILTFCAKTSGRHLILSEKILSDYICYGADAVPAAQMRVWETSSELLQSSLPVAETHIQDWHFSNILAPPKRYFLLQTAYSGTFPDCHMHSLVNMA